jgi:hypothetical protein
MEISSLRMTKMTPLPFPGSGVFLWVIVASRGIFRDDVRPSRFTPRSFQNP